VASNNCDDAILKALGREADARELASIKRKAKTLKDRMEASNADPGAFLEQHLAEEEASRIRAKRDAYNNYLAESKLTEWRKSSDFIHNNPKTGMLAQLIGTLKDVPGAKDSVASRMDRASEAASGAFWNDLEHAQVHKTARDGTLDLHVGKAIWDIQHGDTEGIEQKYGSAAVKQAQIMIDHKQKMIASVNQAGGSITPSPDHIVSRMYDEHKLSTANGTVQFGSQAAFDAFKAKAMKMDWTKSFGGELQNASDAEKTKAIHNVYMNLTSGYHPDFEGDRMPSGGGHGFGNLAKNGTMPRDMVFKTANDEVDWLKSYGRGDSLADTQDYALHRHSANAELIRRFGPNVRQTWGKTLDSWYGDLSKEGNVKSAQALVDARKHMDKYVWPGLMRDAASPNANPVATFLAGLRSTTMISAKVGASIASNIGDIPAHASGDRYWNDQTAGRYMGSLARTTASLFHDGMTEAQRREIAVHAGVRIQDINRPMGPLMEDQYGFNTGRVARFAQQALKYSSHSWWGNRLHTNFAVDAGLDHARVMQLPMEKLSTAVQREFRQFGISDKEWDVIRQAEPSEFGGHKSLQKIDIDEMPLDKFRGLAPDGASDKVVAKVQREVSDKYRNIIGERSIEGTAYPSRALKVAMNMGTQAGTTEGEFYRNVFALKNFIYGFTKNVFGRELFGYKPQPDGSFDVPRAIWNTMTNKGNAGGRQGLALMLAGSIGYGYVRNWLSDTISGKTPQDPFSSNAFQRAVAFQALGIYGDFLMDQTRKNSNSTVDMAHRIVDSMGPGIGAVTDAGDFLGKVSDAIAEGKFSDKSGKLGQELFSQIYHNVPGNNVYWAKYALDYMVFNNLSEMMNPGYQERLKQHLAKHGQQYYLGPGPQTSGQ
jgi:hypothetical protein